MTNPTDDAAEVASGTPKMIDTRKIRGHQRRGALSKLYFTTPPIERRRTTCDRRRLDAAPYLGSEWAAKEHIQCLEHALGAERLRADEACRSLTLRKDIIREQEKMLAAIRGRAEAAERRLVADKARMDWLEMQAVIVRIPLRYGSRECLSACPDDLEDADQPSDIRQKIDAEIAKEGR